MSADLPLVSADLPLVPADLPLVPADLPSVPADLPLMSADLPLVSEDLPLVPTDLPLVPADLPLVPADLPLVPADLPLVSADLPLVPAIRGPMIKQRGVHGKESPRYHLSRTTSGSGRDHGLAWSRCAFSSSFLPRGGPHSRGMYFVGIGHGAGVWAPPVVSVTRIVD